MRVKVNMEREDIIRLASKHVHSIDDTSLHDLAIQPNGHLSRLPVAAVLVAFKQFSRGDWRLLYTLRSNHLRTTPGDSCFPGGMVEKDDASVVDTALREAEEEIGLPKENVNVIGILTPILSKAKNRRLVYPVLAIIESDFLPCPQVSEVTDVFYASPGQICSAENHRMIWIQYTDFQIPGDFIDLDIGGHMYTVFGLTAALTLSVCVGILDVQTECEHCNTSRQLYKKAGSSRKYMEQFLTAFNKYGKL